MLTTDKYILEESTAAACVLKQKTVKRYRVTGYFKDKLDIGRSRVTIACEYRTMVCEPRFSPRTAARKVQTSMCRDHGIVISLFTSRLGLYFHLLFRIV